MLGDRDLSNSDICSSSQGLHEHIQATVMPEINTKINQSITSHNIHCTAACYTPTLIVTSMHIMLACILS
jgi:hypothetical protein